MISFIECFLLHKNGSHIFPLLFKIVITAQQRYQIYEIDPFHIWVSVHAITFSSQLFTSKQGAFLRSIVVFKFYVQTLVFITKCCRILVKVIEISRKLSHSEPSTLWPNKSTHAQLISLVIDIYF